MHRRYRINRLLAALVLGGTILAFSVLLATSLSAASATTIGTDGYLASDEAAVEFAKNDSARVQYAAPKLAVTATQHAADCGLDTAGVGGIFGWLSDKRNDYLCFQYDEGVERTIDLYISASIWAPYERLNVTEENGGPPATYEPVTIDGEDYLRVTVTLDAEGTYVYPVNREATLAAERLGSVEDRAENATGVGISSDEEWRRVDPDQYSTESPYIIQAPNGTDRLLIEWQDSNGDWQVVPEGSEDYAPVYYEQSSENEVLVFAPTAGEPPTLRYTEEASGRTVAESAWREVKQVPGRIDDFLGGLAGVVGVAT